MKLNKKMLRRGSEAFPLSVSAGMHVEVRRLRIIYIIMLSLISLLGLFGSVLTFITACERAGGVIIPKSFAAAVTLICFVIFTAVFALYHRFPKASGASAVILTAGLAAFCAVKLPLLVRGFQYLANGFMGCVFEQYSEKPFYFLSEFFYHDGKYFQNEYCAKIAVICIIAVMALGACSFVRSQNILIFICATFPLPELCLYFGLVPDYLIFGLLIAGWCGAAAADIARLGSFSDKGAERIFSKASAQSGLAAAVIMLMSFAGANLYVNAAHFKRPDSVKEFRNGVVIYMQDFSWDKLMGDLRSSFSTESKGRLTHDGKLGNTESVKFSGKNMLEVTLPSDCEGLYLKGFTGVSYTGSEWGKGEALPRLESNLTSPEFLGGRILKQLDGFGSLRAKDVITRNVGISAGVRYFPINGAGLLETDGVRRRYGVYFPEGDWRSTVLSSAENASLDPELAADELKMREYAYKYCLDVPPSFTASEDFFRDFEGGTQADTLIFIRKELARRCEYSLESGKKPFGADFAQWFLTDNKKGSCTHFASAAVLLCRSMGIPARYCEGFVIKAEDIEKFPETDGFTTVSVPDSRAHAWAEVYVNGFGWMSFESTPGYGNMITEPYSMEKGFEEPPASELTSVSTEAPVYSENPAARTEISETASEEENITETETEPASESEFTDTTVIYEDITETAESGTAETAAEISYQNDGEAVGTDSGIVTEYSETVQTAIGEELAPREEPSPGSGRIFAVILAAAAIVFIPIAGRQAVFFARRRRISYAPDRAAADMYRLLLAASGEDNVPERLAERLEAADIPRELSETVVSAAMKSRFGGGISVHEAKLEAEALETALRLIYEKKNALGKVLSWLLVRDSCLKRGGDNRKDP
ncbi:MAG: transglutaminase-like domain-containing protein [Oscillospiraceae bacterium]|nr:transglutaminase-like domain-containing protein [Oscillospiraceae bacterium]